jgi:hypothetical protein
MHAKYLSLSLPQLCSSLPLDEVKNSIAEISLTPLTPYTAPREREKEQLAWLG